MYFFMLLVPVSRQGVFFLRLGHLCLVQVYFFTPVWKSDLHVYCGCIFLPARCAFFLQAHFWTAAVETKPAFLLHVYFGSICFPKIKRTFICFKIVRVSTRFGELNIRELQDCMESADAFHPILSGKTRIERSSPA